MPLRPFSCDQNLLLIKSMPSHIDSIVDICQREWVVMTQHERDHLANLARGVASFANACKRHSVERQRVARSRFSCCATPRSDWTE
jgi:hypothetical protein